MHKHLILLLAACVLADFEETKTLSTDGDVVFGTRYQRDAGSRSPHVHQHHSEAKYFDQTIAQNESTHFVLGLFEKYSRNSNSNKLNLNGFASLLCNLRLLPMFTKTTKAENGTQADSTFRLQGKNHDSVDSLDCGKITYDELQSLFENHETVEHEGEHVHHEEHLDSRSDLDHQPNKTVGKTDSSANHDGHTGNHNDEADHHDHEHHEHNHDHGDDHNHDHGNVNSQNRSSRNVHHGDEQGANYPTSTSKSNNSTIVDKHSTEQEEPGAGPKNWRRKRGIQQVNSTSVSERKKQSTIHEHQIHPKCLSPKELLQYFHIPPGALNIQQFTLLCPALLYGIDSGKCPQQQHDHDHDHHGQEEIEQGALSAVSGKVWGFSTAAVFMISLVGLLGVAAIPIMQKVFYNHLLQFLVAVAVGALSGDALLHLLPHAMFKHQQHSHDSHQAGHDHEESSEDEHLESVWKGLIALFCIFFFFLVERILTIVTEKKRRTKTLSRMKKKRCEQLCDAEKSGKVGAKLSAHEEGDYMDCDQMVMVVHPNRVFNPTALKGYADATHDVLMHQCDESISQAEQTFDEDQDSSRPALGHSHGHRHGHGHKHCDTVPGSVAAVAWMVIFGDGIHNFSDGLAIGTAFASGVTGGISTSIAVFCHELPHEIGDFAVLLRAGMSVKQAIMYNCVSSLLCFIGMLIGVAIGNITNASLWIFAGVGGMFLYISMVDMLPEMTAVDPKKGENQFLHLLLQVCGMMIGSGIMLLIAVFEHDLQKMLD